MIIVIARAGLLALAGAMLLNLQPPVPGHLVLECGLLLVLGTIMTSRPSTASSDRIQGLADEAARLERGEAPREPLDGDDSLAELSATLRRMALRLRAVDEHAIVAITDRKGVITFVNDRFCEISGYSREELLGKTHRIINAGVHSREFFREMWATISAGKVWRAEIENRAKDGSHYFVATTIVPTAGPDGKPEQYIAIRTEITEQKAAAERLRILSQELTARNSDMEMLIHSASHDMRSPLVNVLGFSSVVTGNCESLGNMLRAAVEGCAPDREAAEELLTDTAECVRFIRAGAEKMDALLKGLLVYSRLGRAAPELQPVNAAALIGRSLDAMRFQIDSTGAELTIGTLPACLADPQLLDHVFSNLLDNAVKYRSPDRPLRIDVSGRPGGNRVYFRIEDNGIGIAPEHRERVFDLFHRLDPGHSSGHGLGLAIVRRALDRMNGTIAVESGPGGGTAFVINLAAAAAPPA